MPGHAGQLLGRDMKSAPKNREILVYKDGRWNIAKWVTRSEADVQKAMFVDREGFEMSGFDQWEELPNSNEMN